MRRSILTAMFFCSLTALSFCLVPPTFADSTEALLAPQVVSLENKFFNHTYPEETMEQRVGRLEKQVFGEAKAGGLQERIIAITATVLNPSIDAPEKPAAPEKPVTLQALPAAKLATPPPPPPPPTPPPPEQHMDYPRVTALEHQMLGQTFVNDPVRQRLERLEKKAFGANSSTDDLSSRTDALEQYAQFFTGGGSTPAVGQTTPTPTPVPVQRTDYTPNNNAPKSGYVPNYNTPNNNNAPKSGYVPNYSTPNNNNTPNNNTVQNNTAPRTDYGQNNYGAVQHRRAYGGQVTPVAPVEVKRQPRPAAVRSEVVSAPRKQPAKPKAVTQDDLSNYLKRAIGHD